MKTEKLEKMLCKYEFTDSEKQEIGAEMGRFLCELTDVELEKKAIASDFKSRIDALKSSIQNSATKLNNGYEMRQIECRVEYDHKNDVVRWIRTDNYMIARYRKMEQSEKQMEVFDINKELDNQGKEI